MLHIICAEEEEAKNLTIQSENIKIHITGAGLYNVLKYPRIVLNKNDMLLNIGYAGSNIFRPGEVFSVSSCERLYPSKIINEKKQFLEPFYFLGAECYTADDFIEYAFRELNLVDMELYYLSLLYPQIRSIKIISDNLNYKDFKKVKLKYSWDLVNKAIGTLING